MNDNKLLIICFSIVMVVLTSRLTITKIKTLDNECVSAKK